MSETETIESFLKGGSKEPPLDILTQRHIAALDALEAAKSAYSRAVLNAQTGGEEEREALQRARQVLSEATTAEEDLSLAVAAAKDLAGERALEAQQQETERKWKQAAKHLDDRAKAAADFAKYAAWLGEAWERLEDATMKAKFAMPIRPSASQLVAGSYLLNAAKLEFTRNGAKAFGERWLGDPRTIPAFVDQIKQANAYLLRSRPKAGQEGESE